MLIRTTAVALALVLTSASGALAAQKKHSTAPAYRAFASEAAQNQKTHSTNPAYDVYNVRGHYVGSDPDAAVRAQIARDPIAE
jgi:hypothetical protein